MLGAGVTLGAVAALVAAGLARRGSRQQPEEQGIRRVIAEAERAAALFQGVLDQWFEEGEREEEIFLYGMGLLEGAFGGAILGAGADRLVISSVDPRFVIKLTHRPSSNLDEADIWESAGPQLRSRLVPVVAWNREGRWLIMERVEPYEGPDRLPEVNEAIEWAHLMGFMDVRPANLSRDFKILDYGEPIDMSGSAAKLPGSRPKPSHRARRAPPGSRLTSSIERPLPMFGTHNQGHRGPGDRDEDG
jgi:hypothetical protein